MTKEEKAVIAAAVALCRKGRGFCFRDDGKISDTKSGKRLECAVAALSKSRKRGPR